MCYVISCTRDETHLMNRLLKHPNRQTVTILSLFFIAAGVFAQTNIPGVSSRYDTEGMIEDILEAEEAPIRRQANRIEELEQEQRAWQRLGRFLSSLEDSAANLHGFRNPFSDRVAESSDSSALTASANRDAEQRRTTIEVERVASADMFQSVSVPASYEVPAGTYEFSAGETREGFVFSGGNISEFTAMANDRLEGLLEIRAVRDTRDSRILVFRSRITGEDNHLQFHEDAETLALETGVIEPARGESADLTPTPENTVATAGDRGETVFDDRILKVEPTASAEISSEPVQVEPNFILEINLQMRNLGEPEYEEPEEPEGPSLPGTGETELGGVTVPFAESLVEIPAWDPEEPPEQIEDPEVLYLLDGDREIALPPVEDTDRFVTLEFPVGEMTDRLDGIAIRNRNTFREIHVGEIEVFDPESRGDFNPVLAIEEAGDALFTVDGVRVTRDRNEIDDVIEDVTLQLHDTTRAPVHVDIEPDFETIEERVIEFLANYNELMTEINILTRTSREVIDQISWLEPDEVEAAEERLGLLQGDTTLNRLRSRFQTIMMNPYETRAGSRVRLLAHAGVSTNTSRGGGVDFDRLRGYLELDEEQFERAIVNDHRALRELFGNDSNGDGSIDSGAAYEVAQYADAFTRTGGLLANRERTIQSSIDRAETEISRQNERLDRREQQLRREFGEMERAVEEMESVRNRLDGLQRQNNRN